MPTVFFGPFIGEFGWELSCWQWWVRRVCLEDFKKYRKIACSFPGRAAFYPYVDEFWPLPESFLQLRFIPWGYATASWRHGWPGLYTEHHARFRVPERLFEGPRVVKVAAGQFDRFFSRTRVKETRLPTLDVEPRALAMLSEFKRRLPEDTVFFVPWQMNEYQPQGLTFGLEVAAQPGGLFDFHTHPIPLSAQLPEMLKPTPGGQEAFRRLFPGEKPLIGLFPRYIAVRRSDRNWPKRKYLHLIEQLQKKFPELQVAIFGEPGGVYFAGETPEGCLSLIDVPPDMRLDLQLAALERGIFALGGASGGLSMAMAAGCPIMWWGYEYAADMVHRCDLLNAHMLFYPKVNPAVDEVVCLAQSVYWMLRHGYWQDIRLLRK